MPYSAEFGDTYYSKADGRLECDHVFIKGNSLDERFQNATHINIGELGFGTGLNFVETVRQFRVLAPEYSTLEFHSFELYPLARDQMAQALCIWQEIRCETQELLSLWPEHLEQLTHLKFDDRIDLYLHIGDVADLLPNASIKADAWYLDGFAPERNRDMWSLELMRNLVKKTAQKGTFATYSAAGWVRRNLQAAGFNVEKKKGYANKREMLNGRLN